MEWNNFTLIGLGLIGGSIAKAIKKTYPTARISVLEKDQHSVEMAISEGIIEKGLQSIEEIPADTELLFLCTPVEWNRKFLRELAPKLSSHTLLTDVGSTKRSIMEEAEA